MPDRPVHHHGLPFRSRRYERRGRVELPVGDKVDAMARALKAKGVNFEHYDLPRTHVEGDVHVAGERRIAWFKDPDGNILSMVSH